MKCVNIKLWDILGCFHYILNAPCTWVYQLLPQLLMEQFDTFPIQCRHIEHMHEGVWLRKKYFFDKMTAVRT